MNNNIRIKLMQMAHKAIILNQEIIKSYSHWKIFPIELNNGAIPITETGYKPINSKITDFGQMELVLTGNTPIVGIWKNSTFIYQKNKGTTDPTTHITTGQDQFYTKQYKIGDFWNAYLVEDISGVDFGSLTSNTIFKTISTTRQYTLIVFEEHITVDDYLQYFVVFNDKNENIGGNTGKNQDRQLLYLSNAVNYYSPLDGSFAHQVLTFSSVNDKATASGQNTLDYVQYGSPGSGYAFPTIIDGKVTLNRVLMRDIGVRYAHRQAYGIEALTTCSYYGRPIIQGQMPNQIEDKEIFEQKVYASRRLFIAGHNEFSSTPVTENGGLFAGINDAITTNSHPETTFYNIMDAAPTGFRNYSDYKEFLASAQVNILTEKSFKGILTFNADTAKKSNGNDIGEAKFFWDSEWNINNLTGTYNVDMSSNFKYKDNETGKVIPSGVTTIDYSKISQKYMSSILNFNSLTFASILQMPYDNTQWLPFAISEVPLIGKMLNILSLGIPVGFIINQATDIYQKMLNFNTFMSAFFTSNMDNIFGKSGLIPLNLFSSQNNFELGKLLGAKVSTTAMLMKLSDRIAVYPRDPETGHKLETKEQISSVDLSQKRNNKIYVSDEDMEFLDIASPLTTLDNDLQWNPTANGIIDGQYYAYIIDSIVTQSLHQGEERHTFFSDNPFTYQGDYNELSVGQYRYNSTSTLTDNLFNWTTQYKLNHDEYEETEETTFDYPANILPPDPIDVVRPIIINPNLNVKLNYIDIPLLKLDGTGNFNNINAWFSANNPVSNNVDIDIKSKLNTKLKIQNFNDLKRFYQSVSIYFNYTIETVEGSHNNNASNFRTTESFNPAKSQDSVVEINLSDLVFSSNTPNFSQKQDFIDDVNWHGGGGYAYYQGNKSQYNLLSFAFTLNEDGNWNINKSFSNINAIGFDILSNSADSLNWKINTFVTPAKIHGEYNRTGLANAYAQRYTNNGNASIYKIVLNPR